MLEEAANKQLSKHKPPKGAKRLSEETTSIVKKRRIAKAEGNHDRVKELNAREWKQPISIPIPKKRIQLHVKTIEPFVLLCMLAKYF